MSLILRSFQHCVLYVARIKKNEYHVPSKVGPLAKALIHRLLQHDPCKRPTVAETLRVNFFIFSLSGRVPPYIFFVSYPVSTCVQSLKL